VTPESKALIDRGDAALRNAVLRWSELRETIRESQEARVAAASFAEELERACRNSGRTVSDEDEHEAPVESDRPDGPIEQPGP
jgi:hypothetical protein